MISDSHDTNQLENNNSNNTQNKPQSYKMIRIIGEGTSGRAYLVENNTDKTLCVIKTINIENMSDEERKSTFIEAKILSKLDHPSIIKFREVFIAKKPKYSLNLVTDYAEGGDLQSRLKSRKGKLLPETQILDWFTQICLGIKHIHDRKIIHRDIKSQNVFLGENGMIKIGDFGIAKCLEWTWQKAATLVGTPYYLSPEIVQNHPYSFKSDIWSLGVLLYEMVALKMPFDATSLPMLSIRIIKGNFNTIPQGYSRDLKNLINMTLIVDPNRRPSINDLLKQPIIKSRIKQFLNEVEFNHEFSHTIIHNYNILKSKNNPLPTSNSSNQKVPYKTNVEPSPSPNNNMQYRNNTPNSAINLNTQSKETKSNFGLENAKKNKISNSKPKIIPQEKKKEDNKEIKDYFQKNDPKKKKQIETSSKYLKLPEPVKNSQNNPNPYVKKIVPSPRANSKIRISLDTNQDTPNSKEAIEKPFTEKATPSENFSGTNTLKEMMKKKRAELKNQPQEEVVWIGKEIKKEEKEKKGEKEKIGEKEKEIKFPKVIIVEKPTKKSQTNDDENMKTIDMTEVKNNYESQYNNTVVIKKQKEEEEFYNLNRYLDELNKINEEETLDSTTTEQNNLENKSIDDNSDNTRDYNVIDDENSTMNAEQVADSIDVNTDNSQIEELRVELENCMGFEIFKILYGIVDKQTDHNVIKYNSEAIKESIIKSMNGRFDQKIIDLALEKVPYVFVIIARERMVDNSHK